LPLQNEMPGVDPREVEQLADEPVEALHLLFDRLVELLALAVAPGHILLPQAAGGGHDRRERCPKLMGDRAEQRGLELVAPPKNLALRGLVA